MLLLMHQIDQPAVFEVVDFIKGRKFKQTYTTMTRTKIHSDILISHLNSWIFRTQVSLITQNSVCFWGIQIVSCFEKELYIIILICPRWKILTPHRKYCPTSQEINWTGEQFPWNEGDTKMFQAQYEYSVGLC